MGDTDQKHSILVQIRPLELSQLAELPREAQFIRRTIVLKPESIPLTISAFFLFIFLTSWQTLLLAKAALITQATLISIEL